MVGKLLRVGVRKLVENFALEAGTRIGEAVGCRVAKLVYPEFYAEEAEPETETESNEGECEE